MCVKLRTERQWQYRVRTVAAVWRGIDPSLIGQIDGCVYTVYARCTVLVAQIIVVDLARAYDSFRTWRLPCTYALSGFSSSSFFKRLPFFFRSDPAGSETLMVGPVQCGREHRAERGLTCREREGPRSNHNN